MVRFQILLDPIEASLLAKLAEAELRDPRDQIRFILRSELERRGLLKTPTKAQETQKLNVMETSETNCALTTSEESPIAYGGTNHADGSDERSSTG